MEAGAAGAVDVVSALCDLSAGGEAVGECEDGRAVDLVDDEVIAIFHFG